MFDAAVDGVVDEVGFAGVMTAIMFHENVGSEMTSYFLSFTLLLRHDVSVSAYLKWATDSFLLSTAIAQPQTSIHTHMCYCDFGDCMEAIDRMDTDVNSIENGKTSTLTRFIHNIADDVEQQTINSSDRSPALVLRHVD